MNDTFRDEKCAYPDCQDKYHMPHEEGFCNDPGCHEKVLREA